MIWNEFPKFAYKNEYGVFNISIFEQIFLKILASGFLEVIKAPHTSLPYCKIGEIIQLLTLKLAGYFAKHLQARGVR